MGRKRGMRWVDLLCFIVELGGREGVVEEGGW